MRYVWGFCNAPHPHWANSPPRICAALTGALRGSQGYAVATSRERPRWRRQSGTIRHVSLAHIPDDERNPYQGDFGEAWVHAAAAACGISHGPNDSLDHLKYDVRLTMKGHVRGTRNPSVLVQVKTTVNLRDNGTHWAYDLDVGTHEVLRLRDHQTRYVLAVIGLSADGETLRVEPDGSVLRGQTTWVSLEEQESSANDKTQVVYLPKSNALDLDGFRKMLTDHGVPRSSTVPDVDEWREGA